MKSKECKKHNHKLTNFLKVFIYMVVMLAPFFAIGVKSAYVIMNKNAKDSYTGTYKYLETIQISSANEINTTDIYYNISNISFQRFGQDNKIGNLSSINYYENTELKFTSNTYNYEYYILGADINSTTGHFFINGIDTTENVENATRLYTSTINYANVSNTITLKPNEIQIEIQYKELSAQTWYVNKLATDKYYIDSKLSNVFYSAINELDKTSIFSWTTNTGVYTAINNMCVNLGIVSPPLAVLLTYWSLITAIYIIIDIVIESFTFLTHWFTDKMV